MASWNLALRFGLEVAAFVGLGAAAWDQTTGATRWIAVIAVSVGAMAVWGIFNVLNDPSRSGKAPVEVPGWVRLAIELLILGAGTFAIGAVWSSGFGIAVAVLITLHYAASWGRVRWLLNG
ncbi:MAG: YrdB family protein, partial [Acidimicrobiia bacterium]